jgi:hypothetical protein
MPWKRRRENLVFTCPVATCSIQDRTLTGGGPKASQNEALGAKEKGKFPNNTIHLIRYSLGFRCRVIVSVRRSDRNS